MPSPRGKRSIRSMAKRFIHRFSYRDFTLAETVNTVSFEKVVDFTVRVVQPQNEREYEQLRKQVPVVEKGLVLSDSRGRGSFQT